MKKIAFIIITFLLLSCQKKENTKLVVKKEELIELKREIIEKGNEDSFTKLALRIGNNSHKYEILPYALIMANKYNSGEGCHQVFVGLLDMNNPNNYGYKISLIKDFSETDRQFAIAYLEKGAKLKNINCILALEEIYRNGWGLEKNDTKADRLQEEFKSITERKK
ncbi:hypothetical protein [Chryseobacterium defluvii]|uniref:Sel1 repeat-containing protein n=1 Tax=Chryseobacterium defluvii TaxID=160396 RepID=A0A495SP12_9FLAO|nr:hypothetical protein [Chryseobacterium defluvii]RKT01777.1 hypothetical protein BCF58_1001 [Chryseobacterium defluvii]